VRRDLVGHPMVHLMVHPMVHLMGHPMGHLMGHLMGQAQQRSSSCGAACWKRHSSMAALSSSRQLALAISETSL
jgi:hypothetical protein